MRIIDFLGCVITLSAGIYIFISGIKKEKKAFFWLSGYGPIIKNPIFNIIYGIILIVAGMIGFLFWTHML